jgi:hypothetical protein
LIWVLPIIHIVSSRQRVGAASAQHCPIVQLIREPQPRLDVVAVVAVRGFDERRQARLVGERIEGQVVADAEVQRQVRGQMPVVLQPSTDPLVRVRDREVADPDLVGAGNRRDRRFALRRRSGRPERGRATVETRGTETIGEITAQLTELTEG